MEKKEAELGGLSIDVGRVSGHDRGELSARWMLLLRILLPSKRHVPIIAVGEIFSQIVPQDWIWDHGDALLKLDIAGR